MYTCHVSRQMTRVFTCLTIVQFIPQQWSIKTELRWHPNCCLLNIPDVTNEIPLYTRVQNQDWRVQRTSSIFFVATVWQWQCDILPTIYSIVPDVTLNSHLMKFTGIVPYHLITCIVCWWNWHLKMFYILLCWKNNLNFPIPFLNPVMISNWNIVIWRHCATHTPCNHMTTDNQATLTILSHFIRLKQFLFKWLPA